MILIIQILAIAISLSLNSDIAKYVACILPLIYIIVMAPAAFTLGNQINLKELEQKISKNWINSDDLAIYIKKNWSALEYAMSASARQYNCTFLSITSFGLGAYYFFKYKLIEQAIFLILAGIILHLMSMRVNRPLGIFNDKTIRNSSITNEQLRKEWGMAATALVAFSELFPDSENHRYLAKVVMEDEFASGIIRNWRKL